MLPWSVMPSAGCPSATAALTRSFTRAAPSSMENSVWVCRCVNDRVANGGDLPSIVHQGVLHTLWTSYSGVVRTIARARAVTRMQGG